VSGQKYSPFQQEVLKYLTIGIIQEQKRKSRSQINRFDEKISLPQSEHVKQILGLFLSFFLYN
jgi:hypothetical protein